jgi:nucleoid-associated protein YgaU
MPSKAQFIRLNQNFHPVGPPLEVQFNPTEFTLNKAAQIADINIPGLDMPVLQFVRGQTETLTLDLLFDSTEQGTGGGATSVTERTDKFYQLIKIDRKLHAPPVLRFVWGGTSFPGSKFTGDWSSQSRADGFHCIVESVRQRFTLFSPEGVPLRATLSVALREYRTLEQQINEIRLESPDHTHVRVVRRGDTLARLSQEAYGDPRQWRQIADHNRLENPLDLRPGAVLEIPPSG